jgi:hypothetical protein
VGTEWSRTPCDWPIQDITSAGRKGANPPQIGHRRRRRDMGRHRPFRCSASASHRMRSEPCASPVRQSPWLCRDNPRALPALPALRLREMSMNLAWLCGVSARREQAGRHHPGGGESHPRAVSTTSISPASQISPANAAPDPPQRLPPQRATPGSNFGSKRRFSDQRAVQLPGPQIGLSRPSCRLDAVKRSARTHPPTPTARQPRGPRYGRDSSGGG